MFQGQISVFFSIESPQERWSNPSKMIQDTLHTKKNIYSYLFIYLFIYLWYVGILPFWFFPERKVNFPKRHDDRRHLVPRVDDLKLSGFEFSRSAPWHDIFSGSIHHYCYYYYLLLLLLLLSLLLSSLLL
jgi:hypothetical protein